MSSENDIQPLEPGTARGFGHKLAVAAALTVAFLLLGEIVAYELLQSRVGNYDYEYKSYVIWRVAPSQGGYITTDNGLRRTTHSHCDDNAFRVWMFGGSGLWGNFNRDDETIPSFIAAQYEQAGTPICMKNYGQRGWSNTQEVIQLMLDLKRAEHAPNLVLFYDGTVDSGLPTESGEEDVHQGFLQFKQNFESWSPGRQAGFAYLHRTNTYQALRWVATKIGRGTHGPRRFSNDSLDVMARQTLRNYSRNREIVDALSVRYGFRYLFLVEPFLLSADKPLSSAEQNLVDRRRRDNPASVQVMTAVYDVFRRAQDNGLVYLGDAFRNRPENLFRDDTHVGAAGSRLVAARICEILRERGYAPQPRTVSEQSHTSPQTESETGR